MKDKLSFIAILILTILSIILIVAMEVAVPVFIVFLVLKLCSIIAWSWFWVCFPAIIGVGFTVLCLAIAGIISAIVLKRKRD